MNLAGDDNEGNGLRVVDAVELPKTMWQAR